MSNVTYMHLLGTLIAYADERLRSGVLKELVQRRGVPASLKSVRG
eukprot:COSAG01_NODE_7593_length_3134_cov_472.717298_2_plen_45_part_00